MGAAVSVSVRFTGHNSNPNTIWNKLAVKLGRQPSTDEAIAEVKRILREAREARGAKS
jgi:hypothetical protein